MDSSENRGQIQDRKTGEAKSSQFAHLSTDFENFYVAFLKRHPEKAPAIGSMVACNICGSAFRRFEKYTSEGVNSPDLWVACPVCLSFAQHRFVFFHLATEDLRHKKVLHFAPEFSLQTYLKRCGCDYYDADLNGKCTYTCDICKLPFENESFDYIVCNHVLEHIPEDVKAISELFRVLKPAGKAFISVPVYNRYLEVPARSPEERIRLYHQNDHVRNYDLDTVTERLQSAGFKVNVKSTQQLPESFARLYFKVDWQWKDEVQDEASRKIDFPEYMYLFICTKS